MMEKTLSGEAATAAISPALASATARAAVHYASCRFVATGITSTSVAFMVEGAMNIMFLTKMKFALAACGLIASGAFVVAQQVGTADSHAAVLAAVDSKTESRPVPLGSVDDDAIVARELRQLDLDLLREEVQQLRDQVGATLRNKLQAERMKSGDVGAAQSEYEAASASYLSKARELSTAQRGIGIASEWSEPDPRSMTNPGEPAADPLVRGPSASKPGARPSAAVIGTIDIDAVFKRYDKVKVSNKEYSTALMARKTELNKIMAEAQEQAQMLSKLVPQSVDYKKHENRVTQLKAVHEAGREQAEREFDQRQMETVETLYKEIQATVAARAKAKGLTHVVKAAPWPRPVSSPSDVMTTVGSSVVYADLRNDLTNEVIRDLNQRFHAADAKISR